MKNLNPFFIVALFAVTTVFSQDKKPSIEEDIPAGWWHLPKTPIIFTVGGYVKTDVIHDFDPIGSPDFFDVSQIPTDGSKGETTHFNVKETRLKLDVKHEEIGIRGYLETDFYGSGGSLRIRHAFVEYKGFLAGQTWSNFMDENIIPATLDFEKPGAYLFARHGMLRYKHTIKDNMYFAIAIEEPRANGQAPSEPGNFENPLPDLTGRFRVTGDWGHVQLSGYLASVRYRFDAGGKDDITQFGGNLSGKYNFLKKDYLIYQVIYGPGIARFKGGESVGLDENGNLTALDGFGFTLGIQHYWTEKLSTLLVYNYGDEKDPGGQPLSANKAGSYFAANLIYHVMKGTFVGVEYLRGKREDIGGDEGIANRIQFSVRYSFNM